jgi:hypothetical protein
MFEEETCGQLRLLPLMRGSGVSSAVCTQFHVNHPSRGWLETQILVSLCTSCLEVNLIPVKRLRT